MDRILAPIAIFIAVYFAALWIAIRAVRVFGTPWSFWYFLLAVVFASVVAVYGVERGRWNLGLRVAPLIATREFVIGVVASLVVLLAADALILVSTPLRHVRNDGFPWREIFVVFLPAVVHEELVFRGFVYQKLRQFHRWFAILFTSLVFAALHGGNAGVTWLALANIFVAGILLALSYEWRERLWCPIGLHLGWNLISGPLLGYNVSGFAADTTIFRTIGGGPPALTGGAFGIEGSVWTLLVVGAAVAALGRSNMMRRPRV
ncbi:MAG: CPBP family intramembrane metalloprotease, partial [Acidobacteria bacterium]|nr:CPBP family intramembrane metalloprotease [Acidobacteriota bacterium]